jgi:diguanylate cyclase (GGDEF)-like protein
LAIDSLGLRSVEGIITDHSAQKTLEEILTHEAHTDSLTGLANRRRFEEQLRREWMHVQRYKNVCALLMVDVDHFKSVNDRCGHAVGDIVLRTLGEQCVLLLRDTDTIGRIGGEEFGVILPEAGLTEAMETAERLRQRIAAIVLPVANNETLQFTVSIGCTVLDGADRDAAVAMARADHAMYQAKSHGRNRVESA